MAHRQAAPWLENGRFDSPFTEHENVHARWRRALGVPRRTELADYSNQRDTRSVLSHVQRNLRLGYRRQSEIRCPTTLGNEKGLRAELFFDTEGQRRILLQHSSRDEVAVEASPERLPGCDRKL